MFEDVPTYPFMIIAALLGGLFLFANARMSRYREAASKFRETIEPTITKLNHSEDGTTAILEANSKSMSRQSESSLGTWSFRKSGFSVAGVITPSIQKQASVFWKLTLRSECQFQRRKVIESWPFLS